MGLVRFNEIVRLLNNLLQITLISLKIIGMPFPNMLNPLIRNDYLIRDDIL